MNDMDFISAMTSLKETLIKRWETVASQGFRNSEKNYLLKICNGRERRAKATKFDLLLNGERSRLFGLLIPLLGLSEVRGSFSEQREKSNEEVLKFAASITDDAEGISFSTNYLLHYVVCGEMTKLGEAIMDCYPLCGVPCGWDNTTEELCLFHPKLKNSHE